MERIREEERRVGKRKKVTAEFARLVGVSERTIRNWKKEIDTNLDKTLGRPKRSLVLRLNLALKVKNEWLHQGRPGWRPVAAALKGEPVDLVQRYISLLKKKERARKRMIKRESEMRTEVLFSGVVWSQDATYLKKRTYAEVIKDRCSLKVVSVKKVNNLKKENVLKELENTKLPLVYMTDNGSAYCSGEVEDLLKKRRVIHLKSLPRTPQNNGCCEIAVREIKEQLKSFNWNEDSLALDLLVIRDTLNNKRLRARHGYRTASDVETSTMLTNMDGVRDKLYADYEKGLTLIQQKDCGKLEKRKLERELIFSLLESNGLIKRYRGSQNCVA